jgi:Glyoxalase-like domain
MMTCPDGSDICFRAAHACSPPAWPDAPSSRLIHLDFDVDDLDATEVWVLAADAVKYGIQPNDHCRVYANPTGRPFTAQVLQSKSDPPDAVAVPRSRTFRCLFEIEGERHGSIGSSSFS